MKKIFTIIAALAFAGSVNATDYGSGGMADSSSISGTSASSAAFGGGVAVGQGGAGMAYQASGAGADNTTTAGARVSGNDHSVDVTASVASEGSTYSYANGVQQGAGLGLSGANAFQGGYGEADANGYADDYDGNWYQHGYGSGSANASAVAGQLSASETSNVNNGEALNVSNGVARANAKAGVHVDAGHHSVTIEQYSNTDTLAGGGSYNVEFDGGGTAEGIGGGIAVGDASSFGQSHTFDMFGGYNWY